MKFSILLFLTSFKCFAMDCQVDGISDSPQKLNCYVQNKLHVKKVQLTCKNLEYELRWNHHVFPVLLAYHEEVESGSAPLVFLTNRFKLIIISHRFYSRAYIESDEQNYFGLCFNR